MIHPTFRLVAIAAAGLVMARSSRADPGWQRATIPGFEIYSDVPPAKLTPVIRDFLVLDRNFQAIWPTPQIANANPSLIIICDEPAEFAALNPDVKSLTERSAATGDTLAVMINFNLPQKFRWTRVNPTSGKREEADPVIEAYLQDFYSASMLRLMGERVPPWLACGLGEVINGMCCSRDTVEFPALATDDYMGDATRQPRLSGAPGGLEAAVRQGAFFDLKRLFSEAHPDMHPFVWAVIDNHDLLLWDASSSPRPAPASMPAFVFPGTRAWTKFSALSLADGIGNTPPDAEIVLDGTHRPFWATRTAGTFADESYEFIQFGLFGEQGAHRNGLIQFAEAASNGPLDEADFNRLFGMSYPEALRAVWQYTRPFNDATFRLLGPSGQTLEPVALPSFRPATPAEIHRFLSLWLASRKQSAAKS